MTLTGRELIDVLERFSVVEWFRYTQFDPNGYPSIPVVVWRFGDVTSYEDDKKIVTLLSGVISNASSDVKWVLRQRGRNWILAPRQVYELEESGRFRTDGEVMDFLTGQEPDLASRAHVGLAGIAKELEKILSSK